jgi:zinc and cadmium transporter
MKYQPKIDFLRYFLRREAMHEYIWLAVYSLLIMAFAFVGAYLPFVGGQVSHSRLQFYLTFSAGVMLGAAFFHVMPDAMKLSGDNFGWWMSLAVVGLFCIERFIAPHSHEIDGKQQAGGENHSSAEHDHDSSHAHEPEHDHEDEHQAAAPAVAGWMAVLGLTIHTFMNGIGLAGQVQADTSKSGWPAWGIPGLAMFFAVFFHKPADALAISTVLSRKHVSRSRVAWVQIGFVAMIPVGAFLFCLTEGSLEEDMKNQLIGAALAFSAGTFLFVALSDLLPEVQFHRHDRIPLFLTLVSGVLLMAFIAFLERLGEEKEGQAKTAISAKLTASSGIQSPPGALRR